MLNRHRDWADAERWLARAAALATPQWEVSVDNLVAFADQSESSDYELLACDDHLGHRVFAFDHVEGTLTPTGLTLLDFLKGAWDSAKPALTRGTPRNWSVAFSVSARSEAEADLTVTRIAALGEATLATPPVWTARFLQMPEGVRWPTAPISNYELQLQLGDEQVLVKKVPGQGQAGPTLIFTLRDPETALNNGRIVAIRGLLSSLDLKFDECDYGLL